MGSVAHYRVTLPYLLIGEDNVAKRIWRSFQDHTLNITAVLIISIIVLIFIQVITRYVFSYSLTWSEELSRYLFVWMIFLSLNLTIRDNLPIRIDFIDEFLPTKPKKVIGIFVKILTSIILIVFSFSAYKLTLLGTSSTSPALNVPLIFIYIAMPIGYALSFVETIIKMVGMIRKEEKA